MIKVDSGIHCTGVMHLYPGDEKPVVALRNVDLDIGPGELVAILGPSGSGKSTLLALLSGMLRATAGSVVVAGHDLGQLTPGALRRLRRSEFGLLLQDPMENLVPFATARQNVEFAQSGAERPGRPSGRYGPDVLAELQMDALADRPVSELSAGEQQWVALATVLATSPSVLLADEPTAHLDPEGRDAVVAGLRTVNRIGGTTTVVVTHDPAVAGALPRTITIDNGQVGSEGRDGREFVVVGKDGSIHLPADVFATHPAGTLFALRRTPLGLELHTEDDE
jgi:putative ABC transport system ATP-binding protein